MKNCTIALKLPAKFCNFLFTSFVLEHSYLSYHPIRCLSAEQMVFLIWLCPLLLLRLLPGAYTLSPDPMAVRLGARLSLESTTIILILKCHVENYKQEKFSISYQNRDCCKKILHKKENDQIGITDIPNGLTSAFSAVGRQAF